MAKRIKLEFNKRSLSGFTGNQLKVIACLFMLCDHIGYMLIQNGMLYGQNPVYWLQAIATPEGHRWYVISMVLRYIGRLAYPIFAFLLAEGFYHTASVKSYLKRLFVFAVISELPFDLARKGLVQLPDFQNIFSYARDFVVEYSDYQSIMLTLLLAGFSLAIIRLLHRETIVIRVIVVAIFAVIAEFVRADYGAVGVILPALFYLLREEKKLQMGICAALSAGESFYYYGAAILAYPLLWLYNGRRGSLRIKYVFYLFYPVHLTVIFLLVYFANR